MRSVKFLLNLKRAKIKTEQAFIALYLDLLKENPRTNDMSKSIYHVCIAIALLERIGNKFPTQKQIDAVEYLIRSFNRKKTTKILFDNLISADFTYITALKAA